MKGLPLPTKKHYPNHPIAPKELIQSLLHYQDLLDRRQGQFDDALSLTQVFICQLATILGLEIPKPVLSKDGEITYRVGSWFLNDCHKFLTQKEPEWMHYVTGLNVSGVRTLDRMVAFKLEKQSAGYVKGDEEATRDALWDLTEFGHALHGVFHSHRMRGLPTPSGIDIAHQERLERGRYPVVSAIFSEDGYIRFFTLKQPFNVEIYGKGVDEVGEHAFKLTKVH